MELRTSHDYLRMSVQEFDTSKMLRHAAQQRDERGFDKMLIIDVDSHHYETDAMAEIVDYIRDPVLRQLTGSGRQGSARGSFQDMGGRLTRFPLRMLEQTPKDGRHREAQLSLRWMDAMGVDYTCLFPTPMLSLALAPQPEMEHAMAFAYNSWLCERVLAAESRIKSMVYLPFNDHNEAYKMVQEFGGRKGVIGFMVTSVRNKPIWSNDYMKVYAAIQELGVPLAFHSGFNWDDPMMKNVNRFITVHALGFTWHNVYYCTNWVINAMPEKFPRLKVIWIEGGLAWTTWLGQRLDHEYRMRSSECPGLKKLPSEYLKDMYYTTQPMERPDDVRLLEDTFRVVNAETQLLYASDYPHWDFDLPSAVYDLPFLSEKAKRNILGENARKLFKLDVSDRFPNYVSYADAAE
jgi:predicted TIM-barrel fold metal-dependent hydrolase